MIEDVMNFSSILRIYVVVVNKVRNLKNPL